MALLKQTKHVPFNRGFDDKIDDRLAPDGSIKSLENCIFTKQGRIDTADTLKEINDVVNDGTVKTVYVVDEDQMFVFSDRGTFLKQGDNAFEQISNRNFFETESNFIAREEQPIHNANVADSTPADRGRGLLMVAYQIRTVPNSSVKYFLINKATGKLKSKGEIQQARDPIPFLSPAPGILFKGLNNVMRYSFLDSINRNVRLRVNNDVIRMTDDDTTDVVKINDNQFVWTTRYWDAARKQNRIDVHLFNFGSRFPIASQSIVISSLGEVRSLGRIFANTNFLTDNVVRICVTLNIGNDAPTVEVYNYNIATNDIDFSFSQEVDNTLSDEVIMCFATADNRLVYGTTQDDIRTGKNTLLYDGFGLLDHFVLGGREYTLIANRSVFVLLDQNFKFVLKTNDNHGNNYRDIRRTRALTYPFFSRGILCAPRVASAEGSIIENQQVVENLLGFALYYNYLNLDKDQDREVEKIGNYYMISGSPLSFFDRREVVEYGYVKSPTLRVDSSFEV